MLFSDLFIYEGIICILLDCDFMPSNSYAWRTLVAVQPIHCSRYWHVLIVSMSHADALT